MKKLFLLLSMLYLLSTPILAQLVWTTGNIASLQAGVCYSRDTFSLRFTNVSALPMTGNQLSVQLPPGVRYVPSSMVDAGCGIAIADFDLSNPNRPIFTVADLPAVGGNTACFQLKIETNCLALQHYLAGGTFQNIYQFTHSGGAEPAHTTVNYNLRYAAIDFVSVSNANFVGGLGSTYLQTITFRNGGSHPTNSFYLALNPTPGLRFSAPNRGVLNATQDTIFFSGIHLGGDGLFTPNEDLTVTYTVRVQSCSDLSTTLRANWGCSTNNCGNGSSFPVAASVPQRTPNLVTFRSIVTNTTCFNQPDQQMVRIINTGNGLADSLVFELLSTEPSAASTTAAPTSVYHIDTASLEWRLGTGGSFNRIHAYQTQTGTGSYSRCPANMRIGRARMILPDMAPGDTIFVRFNLTTCCPTNACNSSFAAENWSYRLDYKDECRLNTYTTNYLRGSNGDYRHISYYGATGTGPNALADGAAGNFVVTYTPSVGFLVPTNWSMEFRVPIPAGLSYVAGTGVAYNNTLNTACPWNPSSIAVVNDTLVARFVNNTSPACFGTRNNMEFHFQLRANCGAPGYTPGSLTNLSSQVWLNLFPDAPCGGACQYQIACITFPSLRLQCATPCPNGGIFTTDFYTQRSNFGQPDNNNNGLFDGAADGSLNLNAVRSTTLIQGDTLITVARGIVNTTAANPQFEFAYLTTVFGNMTGGLNNSITGLTADITIYDVSTGNVRNCNVAITRPTSTNNTYRVDLSPCMTGGFVLQQGDSIVIRSTYRYNGNSGGAVLTHLLSNEFYTSRVANPSAAQRFACNTFDGSIETIGWYYTVCCGDVVTTQNCAPMTISQNYYLSIGPCCSNYAGGNYFRNEIRHFTFMDTLEVTPPAGYTFNPTGTNRFNYYRTSGSGGAVSSPWINIAPIDPNASTLRFVLGNSFQPRGGSLVISDEGYYGILNFSLSPSCQSSNVPTNIVYRGDFQAVNGNPSYATQGWGPSSDQLIYNGADLDLVAITPVADPNDTLQWIVRLDNAANNSTANNSFFAFRSRTGNIVPLRVIDLATNTVLPQVNGIHQAGTVNSSSTRQFRIEGLSNCSRDTLVVYSGWNCTGYPTSLATYPCLLDSTLLFFKDPSSELQILVRNFADSVDMCADILYEMELTSSKASAVFQPFAQITLPLGLSFVPGTVEYEYPLGSGFQPAPNPSLIGATYRFNVHSYTAALNNLLGLADALTVDQRKMRLRFRLRTDCNFISGLPFSAAAGGQNPCGTALPTVAYQVPPIWIRGADPAPYFMQVRLQADTVTACGSEHPFYYTISMINLGPQPTRAVDQLIVRLPSGFSMVSYSPATPGQRNAPLGQPTTTALAGGVTQLTWSTPAGVVAGDSIVWRFRIEAANQTSLCASTNTVQTLSVINSSVLCVTTGLVCPSQLANGSSQYNLLVNRPSLNVSIDTAASRNFYDPNDGQNYVVVSTQITNTGRSVLATDTLVVEYFCDADGNGLYSLGDNYIGSAFVVGQPVQGATASFFYTDTFPAVQCLLNQGASMVAMIRDTTANSQIQCACQYSQRPVDNIVLPLRLQQFKAELQHCRAQLHWQLAAEPGQGYWQVQHSPNGLIFQDLAVIEAPAGQLSYAFQHLNPQAQTWNYYRLQWQGTDGVVEYSPVQSLYQSCEAAALTIYPNPSRGRLSAQLNFSPQSGELEIVDALGRVVWQQATQTEALLELSTEALAPGAYLLRWTVNGQVLQQRFVKQ